VSGFRRRIGKRDRAIEGNAGFLDVAELREQRAFHAEEVEVAGKLLGQRLDHGQRRRRAPDF
jgi:hypothetical protein